MADRPILIISHERSGWHFLANSIALNSKYSNEQTDFPLTTDKNHLESFLRQQTGNSNVIYKSHHDFCTLESVWPLIQQKFHVLHLIRDGRDVMVSCLHYFNKYSDRDFFQSETVGEMMRTNPEGKGKGFHECYWDRPVRNMADRWAKHVLGYLRKHDLTIVKYEDLHRNFDSVLWDILESLGIEIVLPFDRPGLNDRCIFPRKGIIGDWRNHFTEDDKAFFSSQASDVMILAGYFRRICVS